MPVLRSLANVGQDPKMAMRLVQALIESTATPQTNTLPAPAQDKLMNGEDLAQATARAMSTGTVSQNRMPPPAAPPMAAELMSPEEFGSRTGTITGGDTRNMLRGEMVGGPGSLVRSLAPTARKFFLDGVIANESVPKIVMQVAKAGNKSHPEDVAAVESFLKHATESDLYNWFQPEQLAGLGRMFGALPAARSKLISAMQKYPDYLREIHAR